MGENQRRNNSNDMTVTEHLSKIREECCDQICKYPDEIRRKGLSQETLEVICNYECPLRKL